MDNSKNFQEVLDEKQGYVKDDKITLEIIIRAEPAKNLMWAVYNLLEGEQYEFFYRVCGL